MVKALIIVVVIAVVIVVVIAIVVVAWLARPDPDLSKLRWRARLQLRWIALRDWLADG